MFSFIYWPKCISTALTRADLASKTSIHNLSTYPALNLKFHPGDNTGGLKVYLFEFLNFRKSSSLSPGGIVAAGAQSKNNNNICNQQQ
jgi:hypothetical protein